MIVCMSFMIVCMSVHGGLYVGSWLFVCRFMIFRMLVHDCSFVGSWLFVCRFMTFCVLVHDCMLVLDCSYGLHDSS